MVFSSEQKRNGETFSGMRGSLLKILKIIISHSKFLRFYQKQSMVIELIIRQDNQLESEWAEEEAKGIHRQLGTTPNWTLSARRVTPILGT